MTFDKTTRQNRIREALGKLYDQQPPYFREYLRRFREDPTSRVFAPLAEAYRKLGQVDEAIEICQEGLEHHPDFYSGRVALAKCLIDKKDYNNARLELERVVNSVPENLLAQRLLGETQLACGDLGAALHCFKMALLLSPTDVVLTERVHELEQELNLKEVPFTPVPEARKETPAAEELHSVDGRTQREEVDEFAPFWAKSGVNQGAQMKVEQESLGDEGVRREPQESLGDEGVRREPQGFKDPPKNPLEDEPFHDSLEDLDDVRVADRLPKIEGGEDKGLDEVLGIDEDDVEADAFSVEHVSAIFDEQGAANTREITTETLGDLYLDQGQFDRALRIFEKLESAQMTPELARKINTCRMKLGVDGQALRRKRKIQALQKLLTRLHKQKEPTGFLRPKPL